MDPKQILCDIKKMEIRKIEDQEDGSAIVSFELSHEELIELAKVGILKVLTDAANAEK